MTQQKKQLGTLLVEAEIISVKTLERALVRQTGSGKRLGTVLEEMGVITESELIDAIASQFGFKTVKEFARFSFPQSTLALVHEDMAIQKTIFPLKVHEGSLALAVTDPFDMATFEYLSKKCSMKIIPVLSTRQEIIAAISAHYLKGTDDGSGRLKILIVDDSATVTAIMAAALRKEGYAITEATDGVDGLKKALADKPDLIICDSVMPRMDGFSLLRALRANSATADIPAILLTSKASGEEEQRAFEAGFLDFIPKPVQPIRVISRVKHAFKILNAMEK